MVNRMDVDCDGILYDAPTGTLVFYDDYKDLQDKLTRIVESAKEVVRISDRKHEAWDKLKADIEAA